MAERFTAAQMRSEAEACAVGAATPEFSAPLQAGYQRYAEMFAQAAETEAALERLSVWLPSRRDAPDITTQELLRLAEIGRRVEQGDIFNLEAFDCAVAAVLGSMGRCALCGEREDESHAEAPHAFVPTDLADVFLQAWHKAAARQPKGEASCEGDHDRRRL